MCPINDAGSTKKYS
jgi:hypothetical protein